MKSLGFVEVQSTTAAIDCVDIMCKAAEVHLITWERKLGGRLVTVIVEGQVSAVKAAVAAAEASSIIEPAATAIIANPHSETQRMVLLSASRLSKKAKSEKETGKTEEFLQEV